MKGYNKGLYMGVFTAEDGAREGFFTAEGAENATGKAGPGFDGRSLSVHAAQRNEQSKGGPWFEGGP